MDGSACCSCGGCCCGCTCGCCRPGGGAITGGGGTGCIGAAGCLFVDVAWVGADEGLSSS
eukprot:2830927-Amphidinium_carterae.1